MKKAFTLLFAFTLIFSACNRQATTPLEVCDQLGFGWNLGNHFDSHGFQPNATPATAYYWDASTPTEQLYKNLAKAGVAPVIWDNSYLGAGPEKHAYFDHNDGHIVPGSEKIVKALVHACK